MLIFGITFLDKDISETKKEFASFLAEIHACIIPYELHIPYEYWSTGNIISSIFAVITIPLGCLDDIIDHILPENLERIKSFETVGHIAHLNLWPEHEPYAETIGQIIIDVSFF